MLPKKRAKSKSGSDDDDDDDEDVGENEDNDMDGDDHDIKNVRPNLQAAFGKAIARSGRAKRGKWGAVEDTD